MRYIGLIIGWLCLGLSVYAQTYKVGDVIVNKDGSQGVVFWVNAEGSEGWMVALHDLPRPLKWGRLRDDVPELENVGSGSGVNELSKIFKGLADTSGYQNTLKLRKYQGSGTQYPAQLVDFGNGWYVPAAGQMRKLFTSMNSIRTVIQNRGGDALKVGRYWSSTEYDARAAWFVYCHPGELNFDTKDSVLYVRPVRSFSVRDVKYDRTLAYKWNSGQRDPGITVYPGRNTEYEVEVTTAAGCSNKASRQILVASGNDTTIVGYVCPGQAYTENGFNLTKADTTYIFGLQNAGGCRKTVTLHLYQKDTVMTVINEDICQGEMYHQNNFTAWESGKYVQTWTGSNGCDSTVVLNLKVHPLGRDTIEAAVCEGKSYTENGFNVSSPGFYSQNFQNIFGCDSLVTLHLTLNPVYQDTVFAVICQGENYTQHGFNATSPGCYDLRLQTFQGCDSLVTLHLDVLPVYRDTLEVSVCAGDVYTGHGLHAGAAGFYEDSLKSITGCDSLIIVHLVLDPVYRDTIPAVICQGETYAENGFIVSSAGYYRQYLQSVAGCDSLVTLDLKVLPVYQDTVTVMICDGETYTEHGLNTGIPGYYDVPLRTVAGCDSLVTVHLILNSVYRDTIPAVICQGEIYSGFGFSVSDPGFHDRLLQSEFGCDSLVTLFLTVNPVYRDTIQAEICTGEIYTGYGFTVHTPGYHDRLLQSVTGCDSLVTLFLTVHPVYQDTIAASVCEGHTYSGNGFVESVAGYYDRELHSILGCDSLVTLHLTVHPVYRDTIPAAICEEEVYTGNGFRVSDAGFHNRLLQSEYGCDSLVTLFLTVHPVYRDTIREAICEGDTYRKHGFDVSEAGIYNRRLQTGNICDSFVTLDLRVNRTYLFASSTSICEGERYYFRGRELTESGRYEDVFVTEKGCDSLYRMDLVVTPLYHHVIEASICKGERYAQNGFYTGEAGEYTRHYYSVYACDSIVTLRLQVIDYFKGKIASALMDCHTHEYLFSIEGGEQPEAVTETYVWDFGDGVTATDREVSHVYPDSGRYQIGLAVERGGRCEKSVQYQLEVPYYRDHFPIESYPDALDEDWAKVLLQTECYADMDYTWTLGDGYTAKNCEVTHKYEIDDRDYYEITLAVRNADDCLTESRLRLPVYHRITPPNTFSPNGDGINDYFMPGYQVRIVNRNGVEIYKGSDGWDGTYNGKQVAEDTYFYEIFYQAARGIVTKKGFITVAR